MKTKFEITGKNDTVITLSVSTRKSVKNQNAFIVHNLAARIEKLSRLKYFHAIKKSDNLSVKITVNESVVIADTAELASELQTKLKTDSANIDNFKAKLFDVLEFTEIISDKTDYS